MGTGNVVADGVPGRRRRRYSRRSITVYGGKDSVTD